MKLFLLVLTAFEDFIKLNKEIHFLILKLFLNILISINALIYIFALLINHENKTLPFDIFMK